jgi:hypothetical protein
MALLRKIILVPLLVAAYASLISICVLSYYFVHNMPEHPVPKLQRMFELNVHGWIVFLTPGERLLMDWLYRVLFAAVALALASGFFFIVMERGAEAGARRGG